jgi:tetratricopeptide (TPR) repeat protein
MKYHLFFILFSVFSFEGCSLLSGRSPTSEYSIFTSIPGASVYRADGKSLGQTPLVLGWEDVSDTIDGRFVSFLIEKPGYFTRIIFFDATDSINLKIDLEVDKEFTRRKRKLITLEINNLKEVNGHLLEQKKYLTEAIDNYKQQDIVYQENMNILNTRLESVEAELLSARNEVVNKSKVCKNVNKVVTSTPKATVLPVQSVSVLRSNLENEIRLKLLRDKSFIKKRINQKRCPAAKVKYFPAPKTNLIIRNLLTAQFLIMNSDFSKAKKVMLKLEEKNPKVAAIYTLLAYIETVSGHVKKAKRYLKKSLAIDKKDKMARRMLEMISVNKKERP